MNRQQRIDYDIKIIKKYVSEHGQVLGTVSWQMALEAINNLEDEMKELKRELDEKIHFIELGKYD